MNDETPLNLASAEPYVTFDDDAEANARKRRRRWIIAAAVLAIALAADGFHEAREIRRAGHGGLQALRHLALPQRPVHRGVVDEPAGQGRIARQAAADEVAGRDHPDQGVAQGRRGAFEFRKHARFANARQLLLVEVGEFGGHGRALY